MAEYRVAPLDGLEDGEGVLALAGNREVGVFRLDGRVVAYENRCAHQGGPVCTGAILGRCVVDVNADGTVGPERLDTRELHLVCPWHGFEYDLATGVCAADQRFRLRRRPVTVRDGVIYLEI